VSKHFHRFEVNPKAQETLMSCILCGEGTHTSKHVEHDTRRVRSGACDAISVEGAAPTAAAVKIDLSGEQGSAAFGATVAAAAAAAAVKDAHAQGTGAGDDADEWE
jgi:hypothetical protein